MWSKHIYRYACLVCRFVSCRFVSASVLLDVFFLQVFSLDIRFLQVFRLTFFFFKCFVRRFVLPDVCVSPDVLFPRGFLSLDVLLDVLFLA